MSIKPMAIAAAMAISLLAQPTWAQESPGAVVPIGIVRTDAEIATAVLYDTPSPFGQYLPGLARAGVIPDRIIASIDLDKRRYRYSFPCDGGICEGFAGDVWESLGSDQRQDYMDRLADALAAAFPNRDILIVIAGVSGLNGAQIRTRLSKAEWTDGVPSYDGI